MLKPLEVKALPGYRLWLRYSDGAEGQVDLSHLAGKGVFRIWDDYRVFEGVRTGEHGEVTWDDEVDLCGDALYLRLTGKRPDEVFTRLTEAPIDA